MRVGLLFDCRNPPPWRRPWNEHYARTLELIEEAERLGAHTVWLTEHHFFEDGYLPQPLTFAAAVAARTSRVRIGTGILLPLLRSAIQVAEEAAIVDLVSGGRLELGFGTGYRIPEFQAFGASMDRRLDQGDDRVREIRRLWDGTVSPPPIQEPIPIWLGYSGPKGARRAGRLGAGIFAGCQPELVDPYQAGLRESGFKADAGRMAGAINVVLADDPEKSWAQFAPHLSYMWDTYRHYMVEGSGRPEPAPIDPEAWRQPGPRGEAPRFQMLTVTDAVPFIRSQTIGLPVEENVIWGTVAGMPDGMAERHIELVCKELIPAASSW